MTSEASSIIKDIQSLALNFAQKEILPLVSQDEETKTFRPEIIEKLGTLGLTGVLLPEAYGGTHLGTLAFTSVLSSLAQISTAYAISVAVSALAQSAILLFGTETQKNTTLPLLAKGKAIGAFSLSEAGAGSDALSLSLRAEEKQDHYLLEGTKLWCTQADSASVIVVFARAPHTQGAKGIHAFLIDPAHTEGFRIGKIEKKMGCHISHTCELVFESAKVPKSQLLGKPNQGFSIAMSVLDQGRINIGAISLGLAQAAWNAAAQYAKQRTQFGKPIVQFQAISFLLAQLATEIEASKLLVMKAAQLKDQKKPITVAASMAKYYASDTAMHVTTEGVQILGGAGYTQDFPLERYMREAKVLQIVEGTNQIQKLVLAKKLLST